MTFNRTTQMLSAGVTLLALIGAGALVEPINKRRVGVMPSELVLVDPSTPPWVTLTTTSLGAFRGLAVDVLWYRANRLQEEGQYFEANQLSQWITTLQPRFPQVWSFHSWNMAYNISVATYTPEERWDWVSKGISLLRDKGIVYNPTAIRLYRELGWIFFHKIGRYMDEMQWYYKLQLAVKWQELLGAPPDGATTQQVIDWFRQVANSPDTIDRLTETHPGVNPLMVALEGLGYSLDETLLRAIGKVRMHSRPTQASGVKVFRFDQEEDAYDQRLAQAIADPVLSQWVDPFVFFLRKQVLRRSYHMDPDFMLELMEQYGPLDWRHPAAHGCYWSEMGVKMSTLGNPSVTARKMARSTEIDLLNTNRQSIHALQQLAWFGRMSYDPFTNRVDLMPDPRFIPAYDRAMDAAKRRVDSGEFGNVGSSSFEKGHENFLLKAMTDHYLYGDTEQAHYFYKKVRDLYGGNEDNRGSGRYRKPLTELVTDQLRLNMEMMANTNQFIRAMLTRGFEQGLAQNRLDVFNRFVEMAQLAYREYQNEKSESPLTAQGRLKLLPFDELVTETYIVYMQSVESPVIRRSRVWANTPLPLRWNTYPRLQPVLHEHAQLAGLIPALTFPQPPSGDTPPEVQAEENNQPQMQDDETTITIERQ